MFSVVKESAQTASQEVGKRYDDDLRHVVQAIQKFDDNLRNLILSQHDADSDEECDGEFSRYKIVARSAFASPSALANRLGKRGGADSASCSRSGATSRRCKDQYREDPNAPKVLKEISIATAIKSGQSVMSLHEIEPQEFKDEEKTTFFDDEDCALLDSFESVDVDK